MSSGLATRAGGCCANRSRMRAISTRRSSPVAEPVVLGRPATDPPSEPRRGLHSRSRFRPVRAGTLDDMGVILLTQ